MWSRQSVTAGPPEQPSLIVRQKSPLNLEFPFASLSDWLVPTNLFFVRNHFPSPDLDAREWRLRVDGAVERPLELDLEAIKAMRSTTLAAVVECAGNGRVYYEPPREGRLEPPRSFRPCSIPFRNSKTSISTRMTWRTSGWGCSPLRPSIVSTRKAVRSSKTSRGPISSSSERRFTAAPIPALSNTSLILCATTGCAELR